MTATERRKEILRILIARRYETMTVLAFELGVSSRTIRSDIVKLTEEYPINTARGNKGGVSLPNDYHPCKNILTYKQEQALEIMVNIKENESFREILR